MPGYECPETEAANYHPTTTTIDPRCFPPTTQPPTTTTEAPVTTTTVIPTTTTEPAPTTTAPPETTTTLPPTTTTTVISEETVPEPVGEPVCQEDEACWDCATMGNLICGPLDSEPVPVVTQPVPAAEGLAYTGTSTGPLLGIGLSFIMIGVAAKRWALR